MGIAPPGGVPKPVTIKAIEVAIVDRGFEMGWIRPDPALRKTGFKVAIVGSGPTGLAAAQQLARAGHVVTVFERADRLGGLLMYGIPNMKLEKRLVERRINQLRAEGVRFVTRTDPLATPESAQALRRDHNAVLLAIGAGVARDLDDLPGRGAAGIGLAMPYLEAATRAALGDGPVPAPLDARGRRILVIGGGDTGTDCVATAVRQGARSVTNLELMERPPGGRAADNPWPEWPRIFRSDYGHDEAAAKYGHDPRAFGVMTTGFVETAGQVTGVEVVSVARAGRGFERIPGSERSLEADLVLLALGFTGAERSSADALGLALRGGRSPAPMGAGAGAFETAVPGVFAAGDARRGQSLVVWGIAEGRAAARAIDFWLMGETTLPLPSDTARSG